MLTWEEREFAPVSREELFGEVWGHPLSHLAQRWQVKHYDIARWCKDQNIPLPRNGHWQRVRHGLPVDQPSLPPLEPVAVAPPPATAGEEKISFNGETEFTFWVPDVLKKPDTITLAAQRGLQKNKLADGFVRTEPGQFTIRVSESNKNRALRIVDTLIKCWRKRGYTIEITDKDTFIWLREVRQRVSLWEVSSIPPKNSPAELRRFRPTGKLAFRMDWFGAKQWRDGERLLEEQVRDILDHMELSARNLEREWKREKETAGPVTTLVIEEEAEAREASKPIKTKDTGGLEFQAFLQEAEYWQQLKAVDDYLATLYNSLPHTPEFLQWLEEMRQARLQNDPLQKRLSLL